VSEESNERSPDISENTGDAVARSHSLDPDAWKWKQYIYHKTNSTTRLTPMSPEEFCEEYEGEKQDIEMVDDSEVPLFSPEKMKKLVQRTHGKLIEELEHMSEEEDTGMATLSHELIEEIEDLDDKNESRGGSQSEN